MIPGRENCYQGWKKEYNGLLASDHYASRASSFICVDKQPDYVPGGQENKDGRRLYFTSTKCGSLSCPPYKDNQAVNCVVCSHNSSLGYFIVLQYVLAAVLGHADQKRLLLNDPDIVGQIHQMAKNVQSLTQQVSQLTTSLNNAKSDLETQKQKSADSTHQVAQLTNSLNDVKSELAVQKQKSAGI
ncbi:Hypothetical predicted protein [Mytilus galloprovincialis]|uniref:Uncharacterized protein n=1 Tax=Mytilus galloprovincialis TaxID=29158 RepID=A0A8B6DIQ9_MYTGA|nr:Hypothetical predicted protein [Mytilus galloprovincialis]